MKMRKQIEKQSGNALVTLIFFMAIAITITTAAAGIMLSTSISANKVEQGAKALQAAESGAEEALLRLLRDPSYTTGTISVGDGSASIQVSGAETKMIISTGNVGNFTRKVQVVAGYDAQDRLTITSWKEVF